ncbi:MAG: clostripain-related cysteine peptidase [Candidatus Riflebacteria bacterium]
MKRVSSILIAAALIFASFSSVNAAPPVKEWTLAVFLNADNNLDPFGVEDQQEMARVGSSDFLNIVSLIDREHGPAQINYIEKNNIKKVKDMGEMDMGDYRQLVNFMKFVKENYPAKRYCLTVWNHGSGWKNKNVNAVVRGISYDDSSNNHITNAQLSVALKEINGVIGKKVDIVEFDACLMQMVEVVHACKDYCNYIVASEQTEPGKGAPYDDILKGVKPGMSAEAFSRNWVKAFLASYNGGSQGYDESTQSAIDCSKFATLMDALSGFAKTAMAGKYAKDFGVALRQVQKYEYPENIDLIHFATLLKAQLKNDEAMKTACDKVLAAAGALVIENGYTGYSTKNSKGIAIYLPSSFMIEAKYRTLSFAKDSMWDEMLDTLLHRDVTDKIIDDVKAGSLEALKKIVTFAERNPDEKGMYRFIIRELKFEFLQETKVASNLEVEFNELVDRLTKAAVE